MNYISYLTVSLLVIILCSFIISFNTFFEKNDINYNRIGINVIYFQTSYAIEEEEHENDDDDKDEDDYSNNKKDKSIFNIVAVGDWDCTWRNRRHRRKYCRARPRTSVSSR